MLVPTRLASAATAALLLSFAQRGSTAPASVAGSVPGESRPVADIAPRGIRLPFPVDCEDDYTAMTRHIAVDDGGSIWVAAIHGGALLVTRSADGGASWSAPAALAAPVDAATLAGGTLRGHAIVAYGAGLGPVHVRTTSDGGATWSPPFEALPSQVRSGLGDCLTVLGEGERYHVVGNGELAGRNGWLIRTSDDRGLSWRPVRLLPAIPALAGDLVADPEAGDFSFAYDGAWTCGFAASADGGATFDPPEPVACIAGYRSDWALGGRHLLYGLQLPGEVDRHDRTTGTTVSVWSPNMAADCNLSDSIAADADGNGHFLQLAGDPYYGIVYRRWGWDQPEPDPVPVFIASGRAMSIATCDVGAAVMSYRLGDDGYTYFYKHCPNGTNDCCTPPETIHCDAGGPYETECGQEVLIDGSGSASASGLPLTYAWTTDCTYTTITAASPSAPTAVVSRQAPFDYCDRTCNITLTVSDGLDSASCTATIRFRDTTPPVMTGGTIGPWYPTRVAAEAAALAITTADDACGVVTSLRARAAGTCGADVDVTATDACGNTAVVEYSTFIDGDPPAVRAGRIDACFATVAEAEAAAIAATTATDNCPGTPALSAFTVGTCTARITVTATDAHGLQSSVVYVTRIDAQPPVATPGPIAACHASADAARSAALAATTVTDDCPGPLMNATVTGGCDAVVTVTASDACGHSDAVTYATRIDSTPPHLAPGVIAACHPTAAAAEAAALAATTATDGCGGAVVLTAAASGACSATVTVTGSDACGNAASIDYATRIDATPPSLAPGSIAACYPSAASAEAAAIAATAASDECGRAVTLTAAASGTCSATVTVTGTDACGNASSVAYFTRIDSTPPTLGAGSIAPCFATRAAAEAAAIAATVASDACPGPVALTAHASGSCSATVTVTGTDACGNAGSVEYATRIDGEPPALTAGPIAPCFPSAASAEAAAIAATTFTDDCPGPVSLSATAAGACRAAVTVTGLDACGNASSVTYATRIDATPPVLVAGPLAACFPSAAAAEAAAILATWATDDCGDAVSLVASATGDCSATVAVTGTDTCGNSSVVTYATRIDATPPDVSLLREPITCLWPPNGRMVAIPGAGLTPAMADACPGALTWRFAACASDQPDPLAGTPEADCVVAPDGASVAVRARRDGGAADGRHYTLLIAASDACDNVSAPLPAFIVVVPHDARDARDCSR